MKERKMFFGDSCRTALSENELMLKFMNDTYFFKDKRSAFIFLTELKDEIENILECLRIEDERKENS